MNQEDLIEFKNALSQGKGSFEKVLSVEDILNQCCLLRGNPLELIHRTIHEFGWFIDELIFHKQTLITHIQELNPKCPKNHEIFDKILNFTYKSKDYLKELVNLFFDYCWTEYYEYGENI